MLQQVEYVVGCVRFGKSGKNLFDAKTVGVAVGHGIQDQDDVVAVVWLCAVDSTPRPVALPVMKTWVTPRCRRYSYKFVPMNAPGRCLLTHDRLRAVAIQRSMGKMIWLCCGGASGCGTVLLPARADHRELDVGRIPRRADHIESAFAGGFEIEFPFAGARD